MRNLRKDIEYPVLVLGPWGHWWAHNEAQLQEALDKADRACLQAWWVLVGLLLAVLSAGLIGGFLA